MAAKEPDSADEATAGHGHTTVVLVVTALGMPLLVGLLTLAMLAAAVTYLALAAQQASTGCDPARSGAGSVSRSETVAASPRAADAAGRAAPPGAYATTRRQQVANARLVEQGVRAAGGSGRAVYIALVAAVGESDLINVNYGDTAGPDSRGLFQQRVSWGRLTQRMDPAWAAGAFMLGPHQQRSGGLLQLTRWEQLPVTTAIHRVQVNADPNHYTKYEGRAREIGRQAGVDFDATAGGLLDSSVDAAVCDDGAPATEASLAGVGVGSCFLDSMHAPGKTNPRNCNDALTYLAEEMDDGSRAWRRQCMALVAVAYGWRYSGNDTAFIGAQRVIAAGKMNTDRTKIPRGAVLWWDGRATGNSAGHVAVYDGAGHILSNDVPVTDGRVGRVPWTYPETNWHQKWLGWSPPYMPDAG